MSTDSVMLSNHLILCHPLFLLHSVFPNIRVFPKELALHIRWPKVPINFFFFIKKEVLHIHNGIFSSVAQLCPILCDPMDWSMPGLPVHHQLLELAQTHVHLVSDAIQPSHLLSSPSPPAFNLSQHQSLFQWVSYSHQVAKVLELQIQSQSF